MPKLILILCIHCLATSCWCQVSDIIAVKKRNGRTIKNFYEGTSILFQTKDGEYIQGPVAKIHHDTIYVSMYTIQKMPSQYGSYIFDTLNTYLVKANYREIKKISVYPGRGSIRQKLGALAMIGGAGYAALNLINGSLFNLRITDKKNLKTLGISLAAFGAGFVNNKFLSGNSYNHRRDVIEYISLDR